MVVAVLSRWTANQAYGYDQTEDNFYAQVHLKADATIVLSTNKNTQSFVGKAGVNRVSLPLEAGSGIKVQVVSIILASEIPETGTDTDLIWYG
jgi:hypothetical protein